MAFNQHHLWISEDEFKQLGLGINIGESKLSLQLYFDDIVLMTENECDMQEMLDKLHDCCNKYRQVNSCRFQSIS